MRTVRLTRDRRAERRLLEAARYEVIPTASIEEKVLAAVPKSVTITVTASPVKGLEPTLALVERLAQQGFRVVPHLAARLLSGPEHLAEVVARVRAAGVEEVFMPAGDADPPLGPWDGALPALEELTRIGRPFTHVGITGYPEQHPAIDDDVAVQAMWDKRSHGTVIVSNLCFDAALISQWVRRVRRRGVVLPIRVGLAGPVEPAKLLAMATKVGVGESTRYLTKHTGWVARLTSPGYSPQRLLSQVASSVGGSEHGVIGLHMFTFNQVAETEAWRQRLLAELAT